MVQRVPVKIVFDDSRQVAQYLLGPGMSVVPTVDLRTSDSAGAKMTCPKLRGTSAAATHTGP